MTFTINLNDEKLIKAQEDSYNKIMEELNKYSSFVYVNDKGEILKFNE